MTAAAAARSGAGPTTAASYRVLAIRYAERETTLSEVYYQWPSYGEPDGPLMMSYYFWVLEPRHEPDAPPVVVDCGFEPGLGTRRGRRCLCEPAEALRRAGVDPASVDTLILTHLHYDHIGNLQLFPHARIHLARPELEFWTADPVARRPHFSHHTDPGGIEQLREAAAAGRVEPIDERAEVAPGVSAVQVGGHSPGQLVLEVAGEHGPVVLASDAIHYYEELDTERPFAVFSDLAATYRAYDRLRAYRDAGATLVPGHDPLVMERFAPVDELAVCVSEPEPRR